MKEASLQRAPCSYLLECVCGARPSDDRLLVCQLIGCCLQHEVTQCKGLLRDDAAAEAVHGCRMRCRLPARLLPSAWLGRPRSRTDVLSHGCTFRETPGTCLRPNCGPERALTWRPPSALMGPRIHGGGHTRLLQAQQPSSLQGAPPSALVSYRVTRTAVCLGHLQTLSPQTPHDLGDPRVRDGCYHTH